MTQKEKRELENQAAGVQAIATILVRETGYNAAVLQAKGEQGEDWSRARELYDLALQLIRFIKWNPKLHSGVHPTAEEFIKATYAPYKALPEWEQRKEGIVRS